MTGLIALVVFACVVLLLLWWLLIATEGVYLGQRVVIWLYDVYATRYDKIKAFSPEYDHLLLANPIMGLIAPHQTPMVLDVATGTGRLPDALLNHTMFQGRIVGVDLSEKMLAQAERKLAQDADRVTLMHAPAEDLPFLDDSFDVVACLEALEFMRDRNAALDEMLRVLRPGGVLLLTLRINMRLMPGRILSGESLENALYERGVDDVVIEPWQVDYKRVWAMKSGDALPVGARPVDEILI